MLLRRIARPLLATAFVADGVETLLRPEPGVAAAELLSQSAARVLPDQAAATMRERAAVAVRVNAAVQVGAGVLLALGKAPRFGALVLAVTVIPTTVVTQDFWSEKEPALRAAKRGAFLKDLGLLGGVLLAAADTEGKPSLGWWARRQARHAAVAVSAVPLIGHARDADRAASSTGARLAEYAGGLSDLADLAAEVQSKLADAARQHGGEWAEAARQHGGEWAEAARQHGGELLDAAAQRGTDLAETVRQQGTQFAERAREQLRSEPRRRSTWARLTNR